MYLLIFLLGLIIGRNCEEIAKRTYADTHKILQAFSKTQVAATAYYMVEGIYLLIESKFIHNNLCTKDILCSCNRRNCPARTVAISTYARKVMNP